MPVSVSLCVSMADDCRAVCVSLCFSVSACLCVPICLYVYVCVSMSLCVCVYVCICVSMAQRRGQEYIKSSLRFLSKVVHRAGGPTSQPGSHLGTCGPPAAQPEAVSREGGED